MLGGSKRLDVDITEVSRGGGSSWCRNKVTFLYWYCTYLMSVSMGFGSSSWVQEF